jgi:hypothetical protein
VIWLLLTFGCLLFLFILIIFTKLTIFVNYFHHNDNDNLTIEFRIWFGLIKYKKNLPLIKIDDNSPSLVAKSNSQTGNSSNEEKKSEHNVHQIGKDDLMKTLKNTKEFIQRVFQLNIIVRKFFEKVSVKQFEWHTMIGVGDAAQTGIIAGAIWTLKGSIVGLLSHYLKLKQMPNLSVTPQFQLALIQTRLSCIFQFRIGHAILAGLKLIKFWKGERQHIKTNTNFSKEKTKSV